jgi:hypothetical protein
MKKFKTDRELCEWIKFQSEDDEVLIIDGFCEEFVGLQRNEHGDNVAVYNEEGIIVNLIKQGMSLEYVDEYYRFNILGLQLGPRTPKFICIPESEISYESSLS